MKKIFIALCISVLVAFSSSFASAEDRTTKQEPEGSISTEEETGEEQTEESIPTTDSIGKQQLEGSITSLITALTDKELVKDQVAKREKIKEILNARFSATEMAKRTLGRKWKKISPEQREEFASTLRRLIISSYIGKIEDYKDEEVIYRNEKLVKDRYMEIETTVVGGKDNFSVNYKIKDFGGNWLIYDIYIEGISLINNYRSQFQSFLKKKSFSELISHLKETLQEVEDKNV